MPNIYKENTLQIISNKESNVSYTILNTKLAKTNFTFMDLL